MSKTKNRLYYEDNLTVLSDGKEIPDESVDLVYLDPPFNSQRAYNVFFKSEEGEQSRAQVMAFDDTWSWNPETEAQYEKVISGEYGVDAATAIEATRGLLGENDLSAYLVMMLPRLVQIRRVLKPTGSVVVHCDPTASHYLKVLADSLYAGELFINEVIWKRSPPRGNQSRRLGQHHDVLLWYGREKNWQWNPGATFLPYDYGQLDEKTLSQYANVDEAGRRYQLTSLLNPNKNRPNLHYEFLGVTRVWRWTRDRMERELAAGNIVQTAKGRVPRYKRYLDEQRGLPLGDVWTDIPPLQSHASERLGYPTQKPVALVERIINIATSAGDVVLDPFCGCGTTVEAAEKLGRRWIGIDVAYLAIDLIEKRLRGTYGPSVMETFSVRGTPKDVAGARRLFKRSHREFERWAVSLVDGQPNEKQVADGGIDGRVLIPYRDGTGRGRTALAIVSVKGGTQLDPNFVRDLSGAVRDEKAILGILITLSKPTPGMRKAADKGGYYEHPNTRRRYPRIQIITVAELLDGKRPSMPAPQLPYVKAKPRSREQLKLGDAG